MAAIPCSQRVPIGLSPASTLSRFARSGSYLPRAEPAYGAWIRVGREAEVRVHDQPPLRPVRQRLPSHPFPAQASAASPARAPVSAAGTVWSPILPVLWVWRATVQPFRLTAAAV